MGGLYDSFYVLGSFIVKPFAVFAIQSRLLTQIFRKQSKSDEMEFEMIKKWRYLSDIF